LIFEDFSHVEQAKECNRIVKETIENLDDKGLEELLGGYDNDVNKLIDGLTAETFDLIYGAKKGVGEFGGSSAQYLERLSNTMDKTLKVENFLYFIVNTLDFFDINWHHVDWADIVMNNRLFCVLAARGHGKTFLFTDAFVIWKLYRYDKNSKRIDLSRNGKEGYIFSFSMTQVERILQEIKDMILGVPELYDLLYPGGDGWAKTKLDLKNGSRVRTASLGSSVRGAHPGWIMLDDFLKDNVIYSVEQRQKYNDYFFSVIMNMIEPKGTVGVVGTPFHEDDLYGRLKHTEGWHYRVYPSVLPNGQLLWEERFPEKEIIRKRKEQGSVNFSREQLCRPIVSDSSIFPLNILENSIKGMERYSMTNTLREFPVQFKRVGIGIDFSISANVGADYTVMIIGGIDKEGVIWIVNMMRLHGKSYGEQMQTIKNLNVQYEPDVIFAEDNNFQKIFIEEGKKAGLPIIGHNTNVKTKYDLKEGLPSLSLLFENEKIRIPVGDESSREKKDLMFSELMSVTYTPRGLQGVGAHDDIPMSLWKLTRGLSHRANSFVFDFIDE
jgi:hypothetical protein